MNHGNQSRNAQNSYGNAGNRQGRDASMPPANRQANFRSNSRDFQSHRNNFASQAQVYPPAAHVQAPPVYTLTADQFRELTQQALMGSKTQATASAPQAKKGENARAVQAPKETAPRESKPKGYAVNWYHAIMYMHGQGSILDWGTNAPRVLQLVRMLEKYFMLKTRQGAFIPSQAEVEAVYLDDSTGLGDAPGDDSTKELAIGRARAKWDAALDAYRATGSSPAMAEWVKVDKEYQALAPRTPEMEAKAREVTQAVMSRRATASATPVPPVASTPGAAAAAASFPLPVVTEGAAAAAAGEA